MKALYIVISVVIGNVYWSLRKRPIILLALANALWRWSPNVSLKLNMKPKCFWEKVWEICLWGLHCVKSVKIRSFFWSIFSYIHSKWKKIRTRKILRIWTLFKKCFCVYLKSKHVLLPLNEVDDFLSLSS